MVFFSRGLVLSLLALLIAGCGKTSKSPSMEIKYRYLVVTIEAPPDWAKEHAFEIEWKGKTVTLPIAFRVNGAAENFELGAGPEIMKYLKIGKQQIPVKATPDAEFRVGNELGFGMLPEQASRTGVVAFSMANWVAVSPVGYPGASGPNPTKAEIEQTGNGVASRLKDLIAVGKVIEVEP